VAKTTTTTLLQEWTQVAAQAIVHSGEAAIDAAYDNWLHLQVGLDSATPHAGTKFVVQVSSAAEGDEDWHELFPLPILCVGTAAAEALAATEPQGETVIAVADTTGFTTYGIFLFLKDNVIADSEIVEQKSHVANTSITLLDGLTNEHTAADALWNIADSRAWLIGGGCGKRVRVVVDNNYDSGASTFCYRAQLVQVPTL